MMRPLVLLKASRHVTRMLVRVGDDDVLKAVLPRCPATPHAKAMPTLLEGLALWHQAPLNVVLCAAEPESWFRLGLVDALYLERETVHYTVELRHPRRERRRGQRIDGFGSFADVRQLELGGLR